MYKEKSDRSEIGSSGLNMESKPFKALFFDGNMMQVQADPYTESVAMPRPIPLVAPLNKIIDITYPGVQDLGGNTVATAMTDPVEGKPFNLFDAIDLQISLNYLGLGLKPGSKNVAANRQLLTVIETAFSQVWVTATSDLPVFRRIYDTDIPGLSAAENSGNEIAGLTAFFTWYQSMVQNVASVLARYQMLLSIQDHMVEMGWTLEAAETAELFSKLKARNVRSALAQLQSFVKQEYFDPEWYVQMNAITSTPSRLKKSVHHPLMTITGVHYMPKIAIGTGPAATRVYDIIDMLTPGDINGDAFNSIIIGALNGGNPQRFDEWIGTILGWMSPESVLKWARQRTLGLVNMNSSSYANQIIDAIQGLVPALNLFKTVVASVRTLLDVAKRNTALNTWVAGTEIGIVGADDIKIPGQLEPQYFKVVQDIVTATMTANDLLWDDTTKQWKFFTMWDELTGVDSYDLKTGGFPIVTSVRNLPTDTDYTKVKWLFLRFFDARGQKPFAAVNRRGLEFLASRVTMSNTDLEGSDYYAYLNMASSAQATLGRPDVVISDYTVGPSNRGAAQRLITQLFGVGRIQYTAGANPRENWITPDTQLGLYDVTVPSHVPEAIAFLEARSPFRVRTAFSLNLGFLV